MNDKEYSQIPPFSDSKGWIKRDIETIKRSFKKTVKYSPIILGVCFFTVNLIYYLTTTKVDVVVTLDYFLLSIPFAFVGFWAIHVMVNKGYGFHRRSRLVPSYKKKLDTGRLKKVAEKDENNEK